MRQVLEIRSAFDVEDAAHSWPAIEALLAVIGERRAVSASLAARYFEAFRKADGIGGFAPSVLAPFDAEAVARVLTSLQVTGYVTDERLRMLKHADPSRVALVRVSGAVTRHVLDGGRETLLASVRGDRQARGWARVTSAEPCEFCSMLAPRGGVYTAASGAFQAHDHCGCALGPVFI